MSSTDLVFRMLGVNEASKVFSEVSASARETAAVVDESNAAMADSSEESAAKQAEASGARDEDGLLNSGPILLGVAAAAALVGAKCVDMAAKFQTGMTSLVTGAGESQKNIKMVSDGILSMAVATGTSTSQLTAGMYMIESAGFHGAQGLTVLQAAAEGAKVGNADLSTVGNALTDVLNDYHLPASQAVAVTDELVKTVASGKTTMEELGSSLSNVVPLASSAHIGFDQVAGALATMTGHGMSADQASQDLANTIRSLQSPNSVAVKEMQSLGLSSTQVAQQLGSKGLTGTLGELTQAITSHMGPAGTVIQSAFANSTTAAADAKTMIASMPAPLEKLAQSYLQGSITSQQWTTDLKALDPVNKGLMTQFGSVADKAHSFNDLLASGAPEAQTYNAALGKMVGGATGLTTALMLTGENSSTFAANVKGIGAAATGAGKNVDGWSQVTQTLDFKMSQAREVVETLGIKIGMILMPVVKDAVSGFTFLATGAEIVVGWLGKHKTVAEALGIGIAAVLLPALWGVVSAMGAAAISGAVVAAEFLIPIAVVAALGYGILELIKHWGDVEHAFDIGVDFIKDHWKELISALLPGIGMIIVGVTDLVEHWGAVEHDLEAIWHDAERAFDEAFVDPIEESAHDLEGALDDGLHFFETLFTHDIPSWFQEGERLFDEAFVDPVEQTVRDLEHDFTNGVQFFKTLFTHDIPSWFQEGERLFDEVFVDPVMETVTGLEHGFEAVFHGISGFVSSAFGDLLGIVKAPIDGVIGLVDDAIGFLDGLHVSIPSWVPVVGGDSFGVSIPKLPMLASGGLVMPQPGGVQVTVAEAGQAEIVTPLPAMQAAMTAALVAAGRTTAPGGAAGGAGSSPGNPLYMELTIKYPDGQTLDKQLVKFLRNGGRLQSVAMATA
ncbi:phage tail tape measure protein [Streptacidiphilus albus]|uniref:phage tail tape measure protein n=1 Tax=Streptacidiphilus albus TaxID=105425 RepID=UPI00068BCAE7|nr:phage tail tape measure protein [Streptacidiphilus albus]